MMNPLVRELADRPGPDRVPVAVMCRVVNLARHPYYRWLARLVAATLLEQAHLANALFDAHRDDPEFGYRLLADEAREAGHRRCDRRVRRICSQQGWWSAFGRRRSGSKTGRPGPPAHDDRVRRDFTAPAVNRLWPTDITEHPTTWIANEGKLYLCAVTDIFSGRIVGYSISDQMRARFAVDAIAGAVARRGGSPTVAGCRRA